MLKRGLVIGSATALALVVLLLTMLAEPSRRTDTGEKLTPQKTVTPADAASLATVDPNERAIRGAQGYKYSRINKHNQLIQGGGDDLVPKPQGVSDVTHPWARIHLTPSRVLEIRANHGTFVAPDRQPRNGEFQGRVVLTLFEGPPERPVNLSETSKDITLRIFLEDARFDLELGQIESQSKVHVTTPRIDFRGKGLDLNYNEVRKRIEHLQVAQGDTLRIKQANETTGPAKGTGAGGPSGTQPAPATRPGKPGTTQPAPPAPPQFYRSRLNNQVRIQGPALEAEADQLITVFAMNQHNGDQTTPSPAPTPNAAAQPSAGAQAPARPPPTGSPPPAAVQTTQAAEPWLPPDETMAPQGANDLIITWTGPMLVEPEDHPPTDLAGPDDSMMELNGRPMHVTMFKKDAPLQADGTGVVDENITAAHFDYLSKSGRIRLKGTAEYPMVLDSISLGGKLRGPSLVLDQVTDVGHIAGAGTLISTAEPAELGAAPDTRPAAGGRMPPGMKIVWHDHLDLAFYPRIATPRADRADHDTTNNNEAIRLRALKTAVFHGSVTIDHPQFQMAADRVAMALADPAVGRQTLDSIFATGRVRVASLEGPAENRVTIHSDQLTIDLTRDASGAVQPSRLRAKDHVFAELPNKSLESQFLDVALVPQEPTANGAAASNAVTVQGSHVVIKTLDAQRNVRVRTNDPMMMTADHLFADARSDEVELTGLSGKPAIVQRVDGTLISRHMFLNQKAQTVRVDEHGVFAFPAKSTTPTTAPAPGSTVAAPAPTTAPAPPAPDMPLLLSLLNRPEPQTQAAPGTPGSFGSPETPATAPTTVPATAPELLGSAPHPDAPLAATNEEFAPDRWSIITWRDSMTFDNLQGVGQFRGAVRVRSRSANQTNRLRCDDLRLEFVNTATDPKSPTTRSAPGIGSSPAPATTNANATSMGQFSQGSRSLHTLDVRGNAHFEGETWEDQPGGNLFRRITLEGNEILFTEPAEDLVVPGVGRMLIEDYRPDPTPEAATAPASETQPASAQTQPASPIKFSGHGLTLLLWDGRLTINTARNDLLAEDNVRMIHEPGGAEDKTQLFSDRLKTELEQSGNNGLTTLANGQSQPPLKDIQADHHVHVLARGRTIVSDHLQFTAATQTVVLTSDPDHLVEMTAPDDTATYTAEEFDWNLAKDRIEVIRPGPGRMPTK